MTARSMPGGRGFRYPNSARVRRGTEIRALLRHGTRRRCGPLELFTVRVAGGRSRAGVVVPRYGHSSVERNRLKRRLRELVRTMWLPRADMGEAAEATLIRARPDAYRAGFADLQAAFRRCWEGRT